VDGTTEPTETTTPIEPTAVIPADDLSGLDDAQLTAHLDELITEAETAANPTDAEAFDTEAFENAFSRVAVARNELANRKQRREQHAAAQQRAAELATSRPARVPSVADIPKNAPAVTVGNTPSVSFKFMVPNDAHGLVEGLSQGSEYNSFRDIGAAMANRQSLFGTSTNSRSNVYGLMQIRREDTEFAIRDTDDYETATMVLDRVRSQRRLEGGSLMASWEASLRKRAGGDNRRLSLTAAAGWCAPSETLYSLCEMESLDGLIDLPETTVTRGGVRYTSEPTFAQLMTATSFTSLTEAQVIADTPKACAEIPCPNFVDTRLNVAVTCLTGSFLQLSAYPELMARWGRGAMVAHAHRLNRLIIAALVTQAGAATAITTPAGDPATSAILSAVELAATDIRYREGLADDAVIEVVLPRWILAVLRADFTRRNHGDPGLTNAMILDWFAARSVRPQFVRDWQDFWGGVAAPSVGSGAPYITAFPTTVQFLAFPAGSVVLARQDVITLNNVYDSTNLTQNLFTQLFTEEGWAPIYPCAGLRLYSALSCPSGATAAQIDLDCTV